MNRAIDEILDAHQERRHHRRNAQRSPRPVTEAGVVIHGTFILGLPVETQRNHRRNDPFRARSSTCSASRFRSPRRIPAPSFTKWPAKTAGSRRRTKPTSSTTTASSKSTLEYPGLSKEEIFESVERFYRAYYLRPKPILRIIKTMLEDKDVCVRRLREGYEFFSTMAQRRHELNTAAA